jgi:hypothetical protein
MTASYEGQTVTSMWQTLSLRFAALEWCKTLPFSSWPCKAVSLLLDIVCLPFNMGGSDTNPCVNFDLREMLKFGFGSAKFWWSVPPFHG